jgi:hypothetical protein
VRNAKVGRRPELERQLAALPPAPSLAQLMLVAPPSEVDARAPIALERSSFDPSTHA